ncbi:MAG: patatin-like phospholipase family protein [Elusimicrobiota bacterium]
MFKEIKKPVGVFLCGGGALGAWQSGVLVELAKKIEFSVISGFSIGAINSAFYCFNSLDKVKKIWGRISNKRIFKFSLSYSKPVDISIEEENKSFLRKVLSKFEYYLSGVSIFSDTPIYKILSHYISKNLEFKDNLRFYCISHCIETSSPYIVEFNKKNYNRERFIKMVVASSTIPFIFPAVEEKTEYSSLHLVDGGVIGKKNIDFSFFNGIKTIIVISNVCDEDYYYKAKKFSLEEIFEQRVRKILVYHNKRIKASLKNNFPDSSIFFITPPNSLNAKILDFNSKKSIELFNYGENYAKKILTSSSMNNLNLL